MATLAYDPETYDPFDRAVMENPIPFYERLRADAPAHYIEKYDSWVFSRFQDVVDVLTTGDNTFISSDSTLPSPEVLLQHNHGQVSLPEFGEVVMGGALPSPHFEALRQAHIKPLQPRAVKQLADFVEQLANERLDELLPLGRFDLTQEYGGIVSASVVCRLLDIPLHRAKEVLDLVNSLSRTDENGSVNLAEVSGQCIAVMTEYVAKRREAGADGANPMIDGLINLEHFGRPLSDVEIAGVLTCVFVGGTETVPKVTAHGLMELLNAPGQLDEVRADLARNVPVAVEEMIRYCAPAQWFARTAHKDVKVAGVEVKKGQRIIALYGSAKWDEDEFPDPYRFIWNRKIRIALSFGTGQHFCIGIHLARLELRILVETFLRRVEEFSFDLDNAVRLPSSFQWGWNTLPVVIGKGA